MLLLSVVGCECVIVYVLLAHDIMFVVAELLVVHLIVDPAVVM